MMVDLNEILSLIQSQKVLVIGDFMLDIYTIGEVERISPEAPVPILRVKEEKRLPGGAGNAILNLISLGMEVVALGRVGDDAGGSHFLAALAQEEVDIRGVICDPSTITPLKNRKIAAGQQLMRVDYEEPSPLSAALEERVVASLPKLLQGVKVVAISDYAKGFLTPSLLGRVIGEARKQGIPVIVDPKGRDFTRYRGASLIKPNLSEAVAASGLGREASLDEMALQILAQVDIDTLMVTRAKEGISIFAKGQERADYPAHVHEVKDVTGAGDTVLAMVTAAFANALSLGEAAVLANRAAGLAIERLGCARISLDDLAQTVMSSR